MKIFDITLPIYNGMWSYRPEWANNVSAVTETAKGDSSTVYKMEVFSHTGTYIETSQHKLNNNKLLDHLSPDRFYAECNVIVLKNESDGKITLDAFLQELDLTGINIQPYSNLIICTGYGKKENNESYIIDSPYFEPPLTEYLKRIKLNLLGVDTPVIDNLSSKYYPVESLFMSHEDLLLLAPLCIDVELIKSGKYLLSCFPLKVLNVSGMHCRAFLIKN